MAVKLNKRWLKVCNYLEARHGVKVNFSDRHFKYYSAWCYTTKEDQSYLQSENHPKEANASEQSTSSPSHAISAKSPADVIPGLTKRKKASKSLSIYDASQIAVGKAIGTWLQLLAYANRQKKDGKTDLAEFMEKRSTKAVKECVPGCNRRWLEMAVAILERNNIKQEDFGEAVPNALEKGRGKYHKVYLKGPANCMIAFLLNPLTTVYKTFSNPTSTTFAWVGAEETKVLFLNDFKWSPHIIP